MIARAPNRNVAVLFILVLLYACHDHDHDHGKQGHRNSHADKDHHAHDQKKAHDHDKHSTEVQAHANRRVQLSEEAIRRSGIEVETLSRVRLAGGIVVPAEITLNPDRTAHITPLVSGRIDKVNVALGDHVKEGQVLAKLRSATLGETRASVAQAEAALAVAKANFARQQELKKEGIGAQRAFLEAEGALKQAEANLTSARQRLQVYGGRGGTGSFTLIRSPLNGVIIERHATPGEVLRASQPIFVVADLSEVWVIGRVYEQDLAAIELGAAATVTLQAYPNRSWRGTVSYMASSLDKHSRTLPVRVELKNSGGLLRPGLFGTLSIAPNSNHQGTVIAVPVEAIQRIEQETVVFVPDKEAGRFRMVSVTVGEQVGNRIIVTRGVAAGDKIVSAGAFTLKSQLLRGELAHDHAH